MSSIEVEVEVPTHYRDVSVSIDSVIEALENHDPITMRGWLTFLNRNYAVFSKTPDDMIAQMTPAQRKVIAKAFRDQADRFEKGGAE